MRAKIILILALLMGACTTYLFFGYMKRFDEASLAGENLVEVVAAKGAIKKDQRISAGMLEVVQVPKLGLHPQAVKTVSEAEGKMASADLAPGETLLSTRLTEEKDEALFVSRKVKEGYRAVSVGVNFVQSVSNLIEPEDLVDVIYTPPAKGNEPAVSVLLLENIRVLAIGRRMVEADKDTVYAEYSSATLEVLPKALVSLVNADEQGAISLALHTRINRDK
ncbi:Flp pilus assembly protein CpaB [Gorillibacterium sp. sgz5001074]|uniref:Flp pilus assembly protein CpaB n=1 Tax=Gorillibacterium sp. sgz5001074 TaxID=3446695 RepID=UPI003F67A3F2